MSNALQKQKVGASDGSKAVANGDGKNLLAAQQILEKFKAEIEKASVKDHEMREKIEKIKERIAQRSKKEERA